MKLAKFDIIVFDVTKVQSRTASPKYEIMTAMGKENSRDRFNSYTVHNHPQEREQSCGRHI